VTQTADRAVSASDGELVARRFALQEEARQVLAELDLAALVANRRRWKTHRDVDHITVLVFRCAALGMA
jgi:hypothetical protein